MRRLLLSFILLSAIYYQVKACSIVAEEISFCQYTQYNDGNMIARGKIIKKINRGVIVELYEVYRGDETRCEVKIFERPDFDCNGIIFNYDISNFGETGDIILFEAMKIETPEKSWQEQGEYITEYSDIKGFKRLIKPMIQEGNKVKGLFTSGVNSVKVDEIFNKLLACGVEGLLTEPRQLCGEHALKIYPNPAQEYFYLDYDANDVEEVALYDISGKRVTFSQSYSEDGISIKGFPSGVYIVVMKTQGAIFKQKLLISH